jgi:hypothetical protein
MMAGHSDLAELDALVLDAFKEAKPFTLISKSSERSFIVS